MFKTEIKGFQMLQTYFERTINKHSYKSWTAPTETHHDLLKLEPSSADTQQERIHRKQTKPNTKKGGKKKLGKNMQGKNTSPRRA